MGHILLVLYMLSNCEFYPGCCECFVVEDYRFCYIAPKSVAVFVLAGNYILLDGKLCLICMGQQWKS